jgi:hypothetical protein
VVKNSPVRASRDLIVGATVLMDGGLEEKFGLALVPYRFFRHLHILRIALMTTNTIGVRCAIGDS